MKSFLASLLGLWKELGINQRVSLTVAAVAVVAGLTVLTLWSRRPDYQLLFGRLSEKDAASIVTSLQGEGIPHRVSAGGSAVYVPSEHVHRLRMDLASKGLPSGEGVGFEIFDKNQFGLSDFIQRTNYLRALQGELARTIAQLDGVRSARVMIVQPENRLLLTEQGIRPSASVFLELATSRLDVEAVNSVRHLVANSVQGLVPDDVAVVDQKGRVLSSELKEDPMLATASSQIRYRQQVEDYFAKKVESMLAPVVGEGNVVVRVSADIETEAATLTEERYDPEAQVVRSQTVTEDSTNSLEARAGGAAVGITANTPVGNAQEANGGPTSSNESSRTTRTTAYEINRVLTNITRTPGTVKGLTAAVFVAPLQPDAEGNAVVRTEEQMEDLRRIVMNALGLRAEEGQNLDELVTLTETSFAPPPIIEEVTRMEEISRLQPLFDLGMRIGAIALALLLMMIFWRQLKKARPEPVPLEVLKITEQNARNANKNGGLTPEMLTELIRQKPANVGTALRDWAGASSPSKN
jgi:flagellar M-ring protein FliF